MSKPLRNASHERFAQLVASGKVMVEAYREVYGVSETEKPYNTRRRVHRLRWRPDVDLRIQAIQKASLEVSRDSLTAEVNKAIADAADNHTAKATMLTLKGRLHGLLTDTVNVREMSAPLAQLVDRLTNAGMDRRIAMRLLGVVDMPADDAQAKDA